MNPDAALRRRIQENVAVSPEGCWVWSLYRNPKGYGVIQYRGSSLLAHRVAYEELIGPVAPGLVLDHICRNRACVNPGHLEPVTQRENVLRGLAPAALQARQTHCRNGHEFTEENTYRAPYNPRRRVCRACTAARPVRARRTPSEGAA